MSDIDVRYCYIPISLIPINPTIDTHTKNASPCIQRHVDRWQWQSHPYYDHFFTPVSHSVLHSMVESHLCQCVVSPSSIHPCISHIHSLSPLFQCATFRDSAVTTYARPRFTRLISYNAAIITAGAHHAAPRQGTAKKHTGLPVWRWCFKKQWHLIKQGNSDICQRPHHFPRRQVTRRHTRTPCSFSACVWFFFSWQNHFFLVFFDVSFSTHRITLGQCATFFSHSVINSGMHGWAREFYSCRTRRGVFTCEDDERPVRWVSCGRWGVEAWSLTHCLGVGVCFSFLRGVGDLAVQKRRFSVHSPRQMVMGVFFREWCDYSASAFGVCAVGLEVRMSSGVRSPRCGARLVGQFSIVVHWMSRLWCTERESSGKNLTQTAQHD